MAEFSKESGFDWYDFSIKEEFEKLKVGYYRSIICEHFGFLAISNDEGTCKVAMPMESIDHVEWLEFCFITNTIKGRV